MALAACIAFGILASHDAPGTPQAPQTAAIVIDFAPRADAPADAVWLGYLMARARYLNDHPSAGERRNGPVLPTFEEEVYARSAAATIYGELKDKDPAHDEPYFDDLARVESSSFMREYVWTYLKQPDWRDVPDRLKLTEFEAWAKTALRGHRPLTKGRILYAASGDKASARLDDPGAARAFLLEGRKLLESGEPQKAIREFFDPLLARYEQTHAATDVTYYSATSPTQAFVYVGLPPVAGRSVQVLDATWADAYLLKSYGLTELKRLDEAQSALESAIRLSPLNSQYKSELGYVYQARGDCDRSIATYAEAASNADLASDDAVKTADLTRAWRGQGYCLVEQGKLQEAAAMYRKCLALDPHDKKARAELGYVESQTKH